jgi:hypothetical protein
MPRNRLWFAGKKNHPKCCDGTPDSDVCHDLSFLEADRSDFHDRSLIDATQDINKIFMRLEERPPRDRHLALLNTSLGLLLVWAEGVSRPDDISEFVTYRSPAEEIRDALGLKDESAANDETTEAVLGELRAARARLDAVEVAVQARARR